MSKGGAREGAGRKPTGLKRVGFTVSCQPEELERVKKIIAKSGKTNSRFILDLIFASENK